MSWFVALRGTLASWSILRWAAIAATAAFAAGTYAGTTWQKGKQFDTIQADIGALNTQYQEGIERLNDSWAEAANKAQEQLNAWSIQQERDEQLFRVLIANQADIRRSFDELEGTISVSTNLGTCQFSADAVRLLNQSAKAANN